MQIKQQMRPRQLGATIDHCFIASAALRMCICVSASVCMLCKDHQCLVLHKRSFQFYFGGINCGRLCNMTAEIYISLPLFLQCIYRYTKIKRSRWFSASFVATARPSTVLFCLLLLLLLLLLFCCAPYFVATVKTHFLSRRQRVTMRNNIFVVTCESCCK